MTTRPPAGDCLKCLSDEDCGEHARTLAADVTDDMCHRLQGEYKRIWPGAGWPALAEARRLLIAALAAQVSA